MMNRTSQLVKCFDQSGIDSLLSTNLTNIRYLTGFSGSAGIVYISPDSALILTDGRYDTQVRNQINARGASDLQIFVGNSIEQLTHLAKITKGQSRIGLETSSEWGFQLRMKALLPEDLEIIPTSGLIEQIRRSKDAEEVSNLTAAAEIADSALANVIEMLTTSPSEAEFAQALEAEMVRLGSDGISFPTIVGSGPNSAMPHAQPSNRIIQRGDIVVVDFGATQDGYHSDMTRTFAIGNPSDHQSYIHDSVLRAQVAALGAMKVGASAESVDTAARTLLQGEGLAGRFIHSVGHGVGLDIHETPILAQGNQLRLIAREVLTAEPGVYLEGQFGVRIEDMALVEDGVSLRSLTKFTKEWIL